MATTIESQTTPVRGQPDSADQRVADIFVIFGITGDLAKVMTFRSLYRLERRGLLQCPIVGVAVNDWTMDQLQPLLDAPPPVHRYAPGSWGPSAADELTAPSGGWHQPWIVS